MPLQTACLGRGACPTLSWAPLQSPGPDSMQQHPQRTARSRFTSFAATLALGFPFTLMGCDALANEHDQAMAAQPIPRAQYESRVNQFKPERGLAATNSNDVRLFIYEWFTHFEHASPVDFYLAHLDDKNMSLTFPGVP